MQDRILSFPSDFSIGVLFVRPVGTREPWSLFADATGDIVIPSTKEARLEVSPTISFEPTIFSSLPSDAISEFEWVSTSKVSDAAIAQIQHLNGLKGLALWETNIGDEALWRVTHLSNLRWLDVGDTRITDDGLAHLRELSFLNYLTLLNDRITDEGAMHLQDLTNLEGLDLMNTSLTDEGADSLSRMRHLKNLRIFNTNITEPGYRNLKSALPDCRIRYYHPHRI